MSLLGLPSTRLPRPQSSDDATDKALAMVMVANPTMMVVCPSRACPQIQASHTRIAAKRTKPRKFVEVFS
jgi:hypothetical protein